MIEVHSLETRTQMVPGKAPMTIVREVSLKNGKGFKTVKIMRGEKTISSVREPLHSLESTNVAERKFTPGLFQSPERKTKKKINRGRKTKRAMKKRFSFF
jgi:hypothetical protein